MEVDCQLHAPAALRRRKQSPVFTGWAPDPEEEKNLASAGDRILCYSARRYAGCAIRTLIKDGREYKMAQWLEFLFSDKEFFFKEIA
jgi:hypothetical protein